MIFFMIIYDHLFFLKMIFSTFHFRVVFESWYNASAPLAHWQCAAQELEAKVHDIRALEAKARTTELGAKK